MSRPPSATSAITPPRRDRSRRLCLLAALAIGAVFSSGLIASPLSTAPTAAAATASGALGPLTPKDVVYQILTDRF